MADNIVGGLFGYNPQQAQQDYLGGLMVSPAQMGQQGLLQQLTSLGSNAGALMGYGAGRLFGGKLPGEAENEAIRAISAEVQKMDIPEDQKYTETAKRLASSGLQEAAMKFADKARSIRSAALKEKETMLGIEGKTLENVLNRSTLVPKIQQAFTSASKAEQDLRTAKQAYAQADKMNPLALEKAKSDLQQAALNYQQTKAEFNTYQQTAPALVQKAIAEATSATTGATKEVQAANLRRQMSASTPGQPEYDNALRNLMAIESPSTLAPAKISFGQDREAIASAEFGGRSYAQLTPAEQKSVNQMEQAGKIAQMAAQGSGTTNVNAVNTAMTAVRTATAPYAEKIGLADEGLLLLEQNTPKAEAQVDRFLATLAGDKALSMAEVNAIANRNGFVGSVASTLERFASGKATPQDRAQKRKIFEALREVAENKLNQTLDYQSSVLGTTSLSKEQVQAVTNMRPKSLVQATLERRNIPYEPEKYDYKIVNGVVQRAPKE